MQIKTPVIHIDGTTDSTFIITDNCFGMNESRHIFINMYAVGNQWTVISHIHHVHIPFIINVRHNDLYIHTTAGCTAQILHHLPFRNKIRRRNIHIIPCFIDNMCIHILRRIIGIIGRSITKWLYKPIVRHFNRRHIHGIICCYLISHRHFPHLKKN